MLTLWELVGVVKSKVRRLGGLRACEKKEVFHVAACVCTRRRMRLLVYAISGETTDLQLLQVNLPDDE